MPRQLHVLPRSRLVVQHRGLLERRVQVHTGPDPDGRDRNILGRQRPGRSVQPRVPRQKETASVVHEQQQRGVAAQQDVQRRARPAGAAHREQPAGPAQRRRVRDAAQARRTVPERQPHHERRQPVVRAAQVAASAALGEQPDQRIPAVAAAERRQHADVRLAGRQHVAVRLRRDRRSRRMAQEQRLSAVDDAVLGQDDTGGRGH